MNAAPERDVPGEVLWLLRVTGTMSHREIRESFPPEMDGLPRVLARLVASGAVTRRPGRAVMYYSVNDRRSP